MQTARDFVATAAKLATGMEDSEHHLGGAHALHLGVGMLIDRNASAVIGDFTTAVGHQGHFDASGVTGHCFINRVIDDFVDKVVQASRTGGTDVHTRSFAHRLETLEDRDVFCAVLFGGFRHALGFPLPVLRRCLD